MGYVGKAVRRRNNRVAMSLPVELITGGKKTRAITQDLSPYGMFVRMSPPLPVGTTVSLVIAPNGERYVTQGNVTHSTGEAHFAWVLEGRAVQDVFINPRRSDRGPESPKFANWFGTTIRIYDPSIQAWRVNWFNPHDGVCAELIGRRCGKEIVQEGKFPNGTQIRWTFCDITENSYHWRGERLEPDGTWRLQVEFRAKRTVFGSIQY